MILWRHRASGEDRATTERRKGGMGSEVWVVGSMVIITGLAAGQATAGDKRLFRPRPNPNLDVALGGIIAAGVRSTSHR